MSDVMLVAGREFRNMLLKKSAIIATIVVAALLAGVMIGVNYFANRSSDDKDYTFGVSSEVQELGEGLKEIAAATGKSAEVTVVDRAEGEKKVIDGDFNGYLTGSPENLEFLTSGKPDQALQSMVQGLASQTALASEITKLGGNPEQVLGSVAKAAPKFTNIDPNEGEDFAKSMFSGILIMSLMMFVLMAGGASLSMGVVEEKTSRVVEILLATIRPSQLLAGKVLGIGAAILAQYLLYLAVFGVVGHFTGITETLNVSIGVYLAQAILWAVLAFLLYSVIWAALASTVSRQEDVGAITTPMTFVILGGFYLGMFLVPNSPDGAATTWLSMVPLFSPFMMPIRLAVTAVPLWQQGLAFALVILATLFVLWLGGRIYERAVLHTGSRMSLKEAMKGGDKVRYNA